MQSSQTIACVTGATGVVGSAIVRGLVDKGFSVRVLSRRKTYTDRNVHLFHGGLENQEIFVPFLQKAHLLFHCAAELYDESKMQLVNVKGTARLIKTAEAAGIGYFCHLSSAGVSGRVKQKLVNESCLCRPQNEYEKSKLDAEKIVALGISGCRVVILRPTNVVDEKKQGALKVVTEDTLINRLKFLLIGGECSHVVHAENVAAAAIHFINLPMDRPECYFVSCDHEPGITFADLCYRYNQLLNSKIARNRAKPIHFPIIVPYLLRKLRRGTGNMGDVRYSAEKLIRTGFQFPVDIESTLQRLMASVK